jgi:hypothetical protein
MPRTRFLALAVAASTMAVAGCGSSSKSPTKSANQASSTAATSMQSGKAPTPTGPLTRAQLIERGDAICYRLNTRRLSTKIVKPQDYEQLVPALAAYELQGANEMDALTPPTSMKADWRRIVLASHTIAEVTGHFPHYSEAGSHTLSRKYDIIMGKAIDESVKTAKGAGFKECSRFL